MDVIRIAVLVITAIVATAVVVAVAVAGGIVVKSLQCVYAHMCMETILFMAMLIAMATGVVHITVRHLYPYTYTHIRIKRMATIKRMAMEISR